MNRRIGGIVLAVVLAIIGTVVLMAYVNKAKDDAEEDVRQVEVLVVTRTISPGAPMAIIAASVEATEVPQRLVADDALTSLDGVDEELVAGIQLLPGEQLLVTRLVDPATLVRVDVPAGMQEITIALDPERAVGGALMPGQSVGIILSFDPFQSSAATITTMPADPTQTTVEPPSRTPNTTHLTLQQVLVTAVQLSAQDSDRRSETTQSAGENEAVTVTTVYEAPSNVLLVTLAVSGPQAEQITFAAEFGHIWLTRQNPATDTEGSRIITLDQVYVTVS